eukprot:SAG31_NODE_202_length_20512_cov_62.659237_12_plen_445_part_01
MSTAGGEGCREVDGVVLSLVGGGLFLLSTVPVLWLQLRKRYPQIAKQDQFAGGMASVLLGMFTLSLGTLCFENKIYGLEQCDNTGKWNDAVTMVVIGSFAVFGGLLIGSTAFYPDRAARFCKLCYEIPIFGLGLSWSVIGLLLLVIGTFCLDNTLPAIDDCRAGTGRFMLVGGLLAIATGFMFAYTAWQRHAMPAGAFLVRTHINVAYLLVSGCLMGIAGGLCLADAFPGTETSCAAAGHYLAPIGIYACSIAGMLTLANVWYSGVMTFRQTPQTKMLFNAYLRSGELLFVVFFATGLCAFCTGVACLAHSLVGQPNCSEGKGAVAAGFGAVLFLMSGTAWGMRYFHRRSRRLAAALIGEAGASGWGLWAATGISMPQAGIEVWDEHQLGSKQLGRLQRGDTVGGSMHGDRWLQIEFPTGSGVAGWVLAKKSKTLIFMEPATGVA